MSSNATYFTNETSPGRRETAIIIYKAYISNLIILSVVGTLLNLWFLVAILRSRDMRSRLRNKIICNSLVLHLVDSAIVLPTVVVTYFVRFNFNCTWFSVMSNLYLIQDFTGNWLLVMLIAVFIAQIQDFNPSTRLTPRAVTLGTVGLIAFPWVASLVVVPIIVHEYYQRQSWAQTGCSHGTRDSIAILKSVDTAAPVLLAIILVIIAAGLKYRRFTRGYTSSSMQTELISRGPEIDNTLAYVVAVVVSTLCDIILLLISLNMAIFYKYDYWTRVGLRVIGILLSHGRVVLIPLPWLLLTDVRQRIKTWRPWYRAMPGIDLTLTFRKDEN